MLKLSVAFVLASLAVPALAQAVLIDSPQTPKTMSVAFVLTDGATMIDFAGPWEVFQDVMIPQPGKPMSMDDHIMPFELFTVGASREPIRTSGGMTVVPDHTFADAPHADIVVVGAQRGGPGLKEYLQKSRTQSKTVMSVCTGAFKLADAGLLAGKQATTHHDFFDAFAKRYPDVKLARDQRFVQADPVVFSAGGLTSGIDLALHVVELYYGRETAERTATYMEYTGTRWRD
jgi:transcriptional regulator GlxA family with amidase domain